MKTAGLKKELGLSAAQVKQLQELKGSSHPSHMQMMQQMQALHQQIRQATSSMMLPCVRRLMHGSPAHPKWAAEAPAGERGCPRSGDLKMGGGMMGMHGMMQGAMMGRENCPMMRQ